jgi:hypothetical protein
MVIAVGVVRTQCNGMPQNRKRRLGVAALVKCGTEIVPCPGVVRSQPDRPPITGFGVAQVRGVEQGIAEIVPGIRVGRVDGGKTTAGCDGGGDPAGGAVQGCQRQIGVGEIRCGRDGFDDEMQGIVASPLPFTDQSKQMTDLRLIAHLIQGFRAQPFGHDQIALEQTTGGAVEKGGDVVAAARCVSVKCRHGFASDGGVRRSAGPMRIHDDVRLSQWTGIPGPELRRTERDAGTIPRHCGSRGCGPFPS